MSEVLGYSEFMEALDAVNPKAVKKKFKDRKDKDIAIPSTLNLLVIIIFLYLV